MNYLLPNALPFFEGGLSIAEDLIKGNEEQYEIEDRNMPPATLGGLSYEVETDRE